MSFTAVLLLGFFLGMRHSTDADHVVAVSTIVSRERSLRAAVPVGVAWGLGHMATLLVVGGGIILFRVVIAPRLGLGMELSVAVMLIVLGAMNLGAFARDAKSLAASAGAGPTPTHSDRVLGPPVHRIRGDGIRPLLRSLVVGVVHGLAGSAAIALLVLGTIHSSAQAVAYLLVFGVGTIGGMALITAALAVPIAAAAARFDRFHRALGLVTGLASVGFGAFLVYDMGFVHRLFLGAGP